MPGGVTNATAATMNSVSGKVGGFNRRTRSGNVTGFGS